MDQKPKIDTRQFLSDAKFYESYSRYNDEKGRYETWEEAVDRVMDMHKGFYADKMNALQPYIDEASEAYKKRLVLGAQRALQFGGEQLLKHHFKNFNCSASYVDRPEFFGEFFYILLCGAGAGASVQKHHVAKLPKIQARTKQAKTHVVEDSIEGWSEAVDVLMSSYFVGGGKHPEFEGRRVFFDLTQIRPKGSEISGGFKAPGPDGLRLALDRIEHLLQTLVLAGEDTLRPIHAYDISMHIADAVLSGGVRRSATIFLFSVDDEEMMQAKSAPDWFYKNPQRARSNNSAVLVRDKVTPEQFSKLMGYTKFYGEPGFVFVDSTEHVVNPCVTKDTIVNTSEGPKTVESLIGRSFEAVVDGKPYKSNLGFIKTGIGRAIYRVQTDMGYDVKATSNHKIMTKGGVWKTVEELSPGDEVVISQNSDQAVTYSKNTDYKKGWLFGVVLGDGGIETEKYPTYARFWGDRKADMREKAVSYIKDVYGKDITGSEYGDTVTVGTVKMNDFSEYVTENKSLSDKILSESRDFLVGMIHGWFYTDGHFSGSAKKGGAVRLTSNQLQNLKIMQTILNSFGVVSTIYENRRPEGDYELPDGEGEMKPYHCKAVHDLHFSRKSIDRFLEIGGFGEGPKQQRLLDFVEAKARPSYKNKSYAVVKKVSPCGFEDVYDCRVEDIHAFEANGIVVHNCVEISLYPQIDGKTGWETCNLSEINGGMCDTEEDFYRACRSASILGTIQAGYTNFRFLPETTKKICDREALIGVSITGWMNNPDILFDEKVLRKGAKIVKETNREVAKVLGLNPAARTTCVKPSGNASVLLGTASGIHAEHAPMYIRNVQMNKDSEVAKLIADLNPAMVEESVYSSSGTDYVVSFPITPKEDSIYKDDLLGIDHLEKVKLVQRAWVDEGTNPELCADKGLRHNVSNTIIVDDWDRVENYIFENRNYFAGISLLPMTGDKDYNQAPNTRVMTSQEIVNNYGTAAIFASGLIVDGLTIFDDLWQACYLAQSEDRETELAYDSKENAMKRDWIRRFRNFSINYLDGNLKQTEYCLKDVYLLHKWKKIQNTVQPIDWENQLTHKDFVEVDTLGAQSCHGGACEIDF